MIIAHRANSAGKSKFENSILNVKICNEFKNLAVELDVWYKNDQLWLGHDGPEYELINEDFKYLIIYTDIFWHCKDIKTLNYFRQTYNPIFHKYFFHQNDDVTLTSNNLLWTYPGKELYSNSIAVMPENFGEEYFDYIIDLYSWGNIAGVCTDYPIKFLKKLKEKENEIK